MKEIILSYIDRLVHVTNRYYKYFPYLSLLLGILTIVLWERGFEFIRWAFIYLIFIGITTIILLRFARHLSCENKIFPIAVWCIEFINQNIYQDLILFLLPIYYQSSTLYSKNVVFLIIITALAIITTFDNLYRTVILRSKVTQFLFYTFNLFAFLNFCLPVLAGVRNIFSLYISISLSILLLSPLFVNYRQIVVSSKHVLKGFNLGMIFIIIPMILISFLAVNLLKGFIPPVPLKLISGTASTDIDRVKKEPTSPFSSISSKGLETIYCYTSIFAPMGIKETLWHVWKKDDVFIQKVPQVITGGRKEGYRTWSKRTLARNDAKGTWIVDIETGGGQLVGRVRFKVID
ncbi:MAG: DUF2914 domain-containing protein [Deltaproteobacteria bacterium]|nr:DUF2914 domain-containing protein [Deltaproteobacteria bacterium]